MAHPIIRIRRPEVVSEQFEGEAVVVNLRAGRYYAMTPLASEVWARLDGSPSLEALVASADAVWPERAAAERELGAFVERLVEEDLVERADASSDSAGGSPLEPLSVQTDRSLDFEIFTDLEDLLVLDPIHDLDDSGWPTAPSGEDSDPGS